MPEREIPRVLEDRSVLLDPTADQVTLASLRRAADTLDGDGSRVCTPAALRFALLGPIAISCNDHMTTIPSTKAVALLAYLALQEEPPTRDQVLALLWPESGRRAARKNLSNALWSIRAALGDVLVRDAERLALHDAIWIDVRSFVATIAGDLAARSIDERGTGEAIQALQAALGLYRGELLAGLAVSDAPDYELWLATERRRFEQHYARGLAGLAALQRRRGQWAEVVTVAERAIAHDALDEPVYRVLMEAYARLGQRAQALRAYDRLRSLLEREIGVAPLPETDDLRAAILGDHLPFAAPEPVAEPQQPPVAPAHNRPTPFVGRQKELAVLDGEFRAAVQGAVRVVIVSGQLGIGKTRLWQEWSSTLPASCTRIDMRGLEAMHRLPFAPYITWFNRSPAAQRLLAADSPLAPVWLAEFTRLMPDLGALVADLPVPARVEPDEERRRVFEAMTQGLLALRPHPIVCWLDDAHWTDPTTLDWLAYVAERLPRHPLLLVVSFRTEDRTPEIDALAARWVREGIARNLELARLTEHEGHALVAALRGDPGRAAELYQQSQGNPYFLSQLVHVEPNAVPSALADVVRVRLARLPVPAVEIMQAAAVLGLDTAAELLRRVSGRSEDETLDAIDTLLTAGVLIERDGSYDFTHPLVAAIVRRHLSHARSAVLHRRAAEALEALHVGHAPLVAMQLITHYHAAGDLHRAARWADVAAEHALVMAAGQAAERLYSQALIFDPTPSRWIGYGRALMLQGRRSDARGAFDTARRALEDRGEYERAANACLQIAATYDGHATDAIAGWTDRSRAYLTYRAGGSSEHR